jgi:hypothetical protein
MSHTPYSLTQVIFTNFFLLYSLKDNFVFLSNAGEFAIKRILIPNLPPFQKKKHNNIYVYFKSSSELMHSMRNVFNLFHAVF